MQKSMSQCLREAADLIEEKGWGQGNFYEGGYDNKNPKYNFCIMGACQEVCSGQNRDTIALALGWQNREDVYTYNDKKGRTKKQVLARLRKYAALAERRG